MLAAQQEAVELRRSLGDQRALGADLRWWSRMQYWAGDRAAAERSAAEAIAVLEAAGDRRLLALALSNQSQLHMLAFGATDCVAVGERAVALARGWATPRSCPMPCSTSAPRGGSSATPWHGR